MEKLARFVRAVLLLTVLLVGVAGPVAADPGRLSNTPSPVVVVQNVDIAAVQKEGLNNSANVGDNSATRHG